MKCLKCKNKINSKMNFCPYCSIDLTNQKKINKQRYIKISIFLTLGVIALSISFLLFRNIISNKALEDYTTALCKDGYNIIIENKEKQERLIECTQNHNIYYVNNPTEYRTYYGLMYEFGSLYNEEIENLIPNALYLYLNPLFPDHKAKLLIALPANNEEELIDKYGNSLYYLCKKLASNEGIELTVYFNNTFEGINTTEDKLFLLAEYWDEEFSSSITDEITVGNLPFHQGYPKKFIDSIFNNYDNFPSNAQKTLELNRHSTFSISKESLLKEFGEEEFKIYLYKLFDKTYYLYSY